MHRRLAEVLVGYSTEVGQERHRPHRVLRRIGDPRHAGGVRRGVAGGGSHPTTNLVLEENDETLYKEGRDHQLEWISPDQQWNIEHGDVWIITSTP